jgi:hypothetical protein
MYCCFQEELHRSFTEASQKRDVFEGKPVLYLAQMINYISKTRLVTERTVSFVVIRHIDTLKVQS